jgi:Xaa-Pro aminopeptidase
MTTPPPGQPPDAAATPAPGAAQQPDGDPEGRSAENGRKVARLAALAADIGTDGVLLVSHWNAAWLTAGVRTHIDGSRDAGAAALLVTRDGRQVLIANSIEAPRLADALAGLDIELAEHDWRAERAEPGLVIRHARAIAGGTVASDLPQPDGRPIEHLLSRIRVQLDAAEIPRLRALSADAGRVVGDAVRALRPGASERDAAAAVGAAVTAAGMTPLVLLAGGDGRTARFRHPVPGRATWHEQLTIGVCAARDGLVTALSRTITKRPLVTAAAARWDAAAAALSALLAHTSTGTLGASLYSAAAHAYEAAGFPGEETRHHQGGAIAYRPREWVAHPECRERIVAPQAVAWNPTVAETKREETFLLDGDRLEVLTGSPEWPVRTLRIGDAMLPVAEPMVLG